MNQSAHKVGSFTQEELFFLSLSLASGSISGFKLNRLSGAFPRKTTDRREQGAWANRSPTTAAIMGLKGGRVKDGPNRRFCLAALETYKATGLTNDEQTQKVLICLSSGGKEMRRERKTKKTQLPPLNRSHHRGCQQHCKSVNEDCSRGAGLNMWVHTHTHTHT